MPLNAALIGVGRWGQRLVAATQNKSDVLRFTVGVTRTPARAAQFAAAANLALGDDMRMALDDPSIDMVAIATPHSLHAAQAIACAEAGKHVFVIKPLAMSFEAAAEASVAADRAGVKLGVGFPWRHIPSTKELRRLALSGTLGQIMHAESNFCVPRFIGLTEESWKAQSAEQGVGSLITHSVDILTDIIGPIESVNAISSRRFVSAPIDDVTALLFQFKNGCSGISGPAATGELVRLAILAPRDGPRFATRRISSCG